MRTCVSYGKFRTGYLRRTRQNGDWVEFYSTPFVFLTDTFTGDVYLTLTAVLERRVTR